MCPSEWNLKLHRAFALAVSRVDDEDDKLREWESQM